ncbi:MAG TPA: TIGR00730 family Rossman fold protein [Candidatus Paceibacterota bacterium]|nr:TIGR00730 family Rossman fold protein [Candidatus Paceibacterota bacterium]
MNENQLTELSISTPEGELVIPPEAIGAGEAGARDRAKDTAMAAVLTEAIQHGKGSVPEDPAPLVCKPRTIESWRIFKIMAEFVDGFEILKRYGLTATFFGTARESFSPEVYAAATELAGKLAKAGFSIITGGSAGVMQAANKGAYDAGGSSIGLNIRLSDHQPLNGYLTDSLVFDHFFVRKVMLAFASEVYIYFPGGFGTLDEFTEMVTLIQTKKIKPIPIVLYGREYWSPFIDLFRNHLLAKYHAIDEADLELFHLVDSVDEAFEYITQNAKC